MGTQTQEPQIQNGQAVSVLNLGPPEAEVVDLTRLQYTDDAAREIGLPSMEAMKVLKRVAKELAGTAFCPKAFEGKPEAIFAAAITGREMGFTPMQALRAFWPSPDGRLGMYSQAMLALMLKSKFKFDWLKCDRNGCEVMVERPDGNKLHTSWDLEDSRVAGLLEGARQHKKYPTDMCMNRVIGRVFRFLGADLGGGNMYTPEEIEHFVDEPQSTLAPPTDKDEQVVVEVQAGRRKKADAPAPETAPAPVAVAPTKVSETFHIGYALEPDQSNYDTACLRAQAIANEKKVPVEVTRVTSFSDNTTAEVSVGVFKPPAEMPSQTPPVAPAAPSQAAPATPAPSPAPATPAPVQQGDTAKEEVIARARAAYALIPGEDKLRKQIGDMFCSGFYGVSVPKEWPRNIEDRTKGVEALEFAIKNDMARLISSPVTARDFGRELAAKADKGPADSKPATPAPDPSAGLYRKLNWSPETCAVAGKFKAKFGIEPQDLEDYIASLKIDALPDQDARGYMAVGAVVGRTYKAEGGTDQYPMKTLFALGEKGAGSYSDIVQALEMFNERPLAEIAPAKLVADLTKMLTRLAPEPVQTASAGDGWE